MLKIKLQGEIGVEVTAKYVAEQLAAVSGESDSLVIDLYSPGGDYFEGLAIHNTIKAYPGKKKVRIQGLAASMATYIMLAADEIEIEADAYIMIHNPMTSAYGDYKVLENKIELLKKLSADMRQAYAARSGKSVEMIEQMMNKETWMSADEAVEVGFADRKVEAAQNIAALIDERFLINAPARVQALSKANNKQQTHEDDYMKSDLIKVLAMSEESDEKQIVESVKSLSDKVTALNEDLQAKTELVSGLNASIEAKALELESMKSEIEAFTVEKTTAKFIEDSGVMISGEAEQKLQSRVKAYLKDTDDESKANRKEDIQLFIKAFGVKNKDVQTDVNRKDFTTVDAQALEEKLTERVNEKLKGVKNVTAHAYAKAVEEAKTEIQEGK